MKIRGETAEFETIPALIDDRAARWGDALAFTIAGRELTYQDVASRSASLAAGLAERGVGDDYAALAAWAALRGPGQPRG